MTLLDVTIIESITGRDLITGDDLSGLERALKLGMAVIDIVTFGQAGIFEEGIKAGTKSLLKLMGVELVSNGTTLTVSEACNMFNVPPVVTFFIKSWLRICIIKSRNKILNKKCKGQCNL